MFINFKSQMLSVVRNLFSKVFSNKFLEKNIIDIELLLIKYCYFTLKHFLKLTLLAKIKTLSNYIE